MNEVKQIVSDIKNGQARPIYFLMGDEPYYIDKISDYIQEQVLSPEEKAFNQIVVYGRDTQIDDIVSQAKRYPMMADKTVVIVKEAQDLSRSIEKLNDYAANPQSSTVLVVNYKYKTLDKRKKLAKTIAKTGVLFESKKLYENQVADWIAKIIKGKKKTIEPKAIMMLVGYLGNDLNLINNEIEKLLLILTEESIITAQHIEEYIGISKDFNNFELQEAVGAKDIKKSNSIIRHFAQNPRAHPLVMTLSLLYNYFSNLLLYHGLKDKSKGNVANKLKVHPFFVDQYAKAARNYPMKKVAQVIHLIKEADLKSKGVGASNLADDQILKTLVYRMLHD